MTDAPQVHLIVFSKDRPLQLHGYLTSLFQHWRGDFKVSVLMQDQPPYDRAYGAVHGEFIGRGVQFWREGDFGRELSGALALFDTPYVCFGCDDVVFTLPVFGLAISDAFRDEPRLLGYSLRLGDNIEADMFGRPMPQPTLTKHPVPPFDEYGVLSSFDRYLRWDAAEAVGDWGYPWEVLGTVYPVDYVKATVAALARDGQVQNPSTLEDAGWRRWREHAGGRHLMQSFSCSRLVVPTVNVVQSVFGNGIVGGAGLDPAFLLDCWDRGLRLDVNAFRGMAPASWRISDFHLRRAG